MYFISTTHRRCSQPIATFNSLDKSVKFFCDLDIFNFYNKAEVGNLMTHLNLVNHDTKNQVGSSNINLVDYYTKAGIDTALYTIYPSLTLLVDSSYDKSRFR